MELLKVSKGYISLYIVFNKQAADISVVLGTLVLLFYLPMSLYLPLTLLSDVSSLPFLDDLPPEPLSP